MKQVYHVSEAKYAKLFSECYELASQIEQYPLSAKASSKIKFIYDEAKKLAACPKEKNRATSSADGVVFEILNLFKNNFADILDEKIDLVLVIAKNKDWWQKFMYEFPLGEYGKMAADFLISKQLLAGRLLEVGAGVGNTSSLIARHVSPEKYIRTDLNIRLLKQMNVPGTISYYDLNEPGRWTDLDLVFATNVYHCADHKLTSLKHAYDMLKPGGLLLLAEGSPVSRAGTPWALNFLFGIYTGWWDQGGFLERNKWVELMNQAGFVSVDFSAMRAGDHDLGGLIWGYRD